MSRDPIRQRRWHRRGKAIGRLFLAVGLALALVPLAATPRWRSPGRELRGVQVQTPPKIAVALEAVATPRNGATGRFKASVERGVLVGDRVVEGFTAGGAAGTDLCDVGSIPAGEGGEGWLQWRVEATVEAADAGSVTLSLAWQRSVVDAATGARAVVVNDHRAIRLQPDDVHVFDLVQADAGSPSACANVLLRVRAARAEAPAIARTWLTYDVWLFYEGAGGERATRHVALAGAGDVPVTVEFTPLRWGLDRTFADGTSQAAVQVAVRGTIRGRCRADGAVDTVLDTVRTAVLGETGGTGQGRKQFVLTPGGAVAIEIPNPTTTITAPWTVVPRGTQPWAPGVQGSADTVTVDLGEFFRGSRVRVLVSGRCE